MADHAEQQAGFFDLSKRPWSPGKKAMRNRPSPSSKTVLSPDSKVCVANLERCETCLSGSRFVTVGSLRRGAHWPPLNSVIRLTNFAGLFFHRRTSTRIPPETTGPDKRRSGWFQVKKKAAGTAMRADSGTNARMLE